MTEARFIPNLPELCKALFVDGKDFPPSIAKQVESQSYAAVSVGVSVYAQMVIDMTGKIEQSQPTQQQGKLYTSPAEGPKGLL